MNGLQVILKGTSVLFLSIAIITACRTSATKPQPVFQTNTPPPKTLIPPPASPIQTPGPAETIYRLTTRAGQQLRFSSLRLEPNEYVAFHTESLPQGVPLSSGEEIPFAYILRIEFSQPSPDWDDTAHSGTWPVILTQRNQEVRHASLGFKAHHKFRVTGYSDFGYVEIELPDVREIAVTHAGPPLPTPIPEIDEAALSVETIDGIRVAVSDPKIFVRCMYEVYCCRDETLPGIPALSRNVDFSAVRSVEFINEYEIRVEGQDGKTFTSRLRKSAVCPDTAWRLRGKYNLGDYEIELGSVRRIDRGIFLPAEIKP